MWGNTVQLQVHLAMDSFSGNFFFFVELRLSIKIKINLAKISTNLLFFALYDRRLLMRNKKSKPGMFTLSMKNWSCIESWKNLLYLFTILQSLEVFVLTTRPFQPIWAPLSTRLQNVGPTTKFQWQGTSAGPLSSTLSQHWNVAGQLPTLLRIYCHLTCCSYSRFWWTIASNQLLALTSYLGGSCARGSCVLLEWCPK